jgi:protein phosphatase
MNQLAPIRAAMRTDRGLVRDHNEDYILCHEPTSPQDEQVNGWLYVVADGVGGADAGEVASEYASTQTLLHYINNSEQEHLGQRLVEAMQASNTDLRDLVAHRNGKQRMATTMVAVVFAGGRAYFANVGDSRGYHWRDGTLRQITKDQSLVAKLVEEGAITEEEAASHPHRNVILYSIGSEKKPQIDLFELPVAPGDKVLLCSDGLTRHVSDEEICAFLENADLEQTATEMVALANQRGGQDNISVAVVDYGLPASDPAAERESSAATQEKEDTAVDEPLNHAFLLPYTVFLSLVEAVLIVTVWLLLRI